MFVRKKRGAKRGSKGQEAERPQTDCRAAPARKASSSATST